MTDDNLEAMPKRRGLIGSVFWLAFRLPGKIVMWFQYFFPRHGQVLASARRYGNPYIEFMFSLMFWGVVGILVNGAFKHQAEARPTITAEQGLVETASASKVQPSSSTEQATSAQPGNQINVANGSPTVPAVPGNEENERRGAGEMEPPATTANVVPAAIAPEYAMVPARLGLPANVASQSLPALTRPSFECDRATQPDEFAICHDAELASLDNVASSEFYKAKKIRGSKVVVPITRSLLKDRAACGFDRDCVAFVTRKSIGIYRSLSADAFE